MKAKHTLMILGGLLSSAAALIPLTSYAAPTCTTPSTSCSDNATVTVSVQPTISITAASGASLNAETDQIATGSISATIVSNQAYTVAISATEPRMIRQKDTSGGGNVDNPGERDVINSVDGLTAGTNGWGIKKKAPLTSATADATTYSQITTSTSNIFYQSNTGTSGQKVDFAVGVGTTSSLNSGTFLTTVTITAATTGA